MPVMLSGRAEVCGASHSAWREQLAEVAHDIFHRPEYHALSGFGHAGVPQVFVYEEGDRRFLWPYLRREIPGTDRFDVTSVYGYGGPVGDRDEDFLARACRELAGAWREQRVVAAFTRFHPLLENAPLAAPLEAGQLGVSAAGSTVSMDLTVPLDQQVRGYQKVLRQEIRKARELGFDTSEDAGWEHTAEFVRVYRETMGRRNSRAEYLIDEAWVAECRAALPGHVHLFVTKYEGVVAAALLAFEYGPFLHAHLTGINGDLAAHSPLKVLLDGIRIWGTERGLRSFHLGGGLGGREDSLFHFKRRFSPLSHSFQLGRWIVDPAHYGELERAHRERLVAEGHALEQVEFFPAYRYQPAA